MFGDLLCKIYFLNVHKTPTCMFPCSLALEHNDYENFLNRNVWLMSISLEVANGGKLSDNFSELP